MPSTEYAHSAMKPIRRRIKVVAMRKKSLIKSIFQKVQIKKKIDTTIINIDLQHDWMYSKIQVHLSEHMQSLR